MAGMGMPSVRVRRRCWFRIGRAGFLFRRQGHQGALDAGNGLDRTIGSLAQRLQLVGTISGHGDRKVDLAVGNEDIADHAEIDDIAFKIRATHRLQRFKNAFARHIRHDHPHKLASEPR
ncbi:hypothetical protein D3C87_1758480 [compost metagenome]